VATIVDVARRAGVSLSTVSHVMNGTRNVSDETRARVEKAIAETGYVRDASARAMRRSRTDSVGLIVSDTGQPVFAEMVRGVEEVASQHGLTLLLANSAEDPAREAEALRVLAERRVDGLIIAVSAESDPAPLARWRESGIPLVLLDRLGDPSLDQVGVDNVEPMATLVSHLLDHGHRRIALLAGDLAVATLAERRLGYLTALERHGVVPDPSLILTGTGMAGDAERAALELFSRKDRPTALVTASTPMAAGALRAASQLGLRLPDDLAFAAFDNLPFGDLFSPPLTTMDQPAGEIGREAMRLLLRRLADPDARPSTVRLRPTFNHRASCCSADDAIAPQTPAPTVGTGTKRSATTSRRRSGTTSKG
jgi:LacI family transcriptional regulator